MFDVVGAVAAINARRIPDREAVVDGDRRLSWRELDQRVNRLANALRHGLGISSGERVSILSENRLEYYEYFHATAVAGIIAVPLNQRLVVDELIQITERIEPRAIVYSARFREEAEDLAERFSMERIPLDDPSAPFAYDTLLAGASPDWDGWRPRPEDAATICFTGGTTGLPKGVVISHGALVVNGRIATVAQGLRGGDRHLFVRPMAVAPGHRMVAWHGYTGGTTIIAERFDPGEFLRLVAAERAEVCLLAPTMFQMLLDEGIPAGTDLSSLVAISYGGAPITPDLLGQVVETLDCELYGPYGGTEQSIATVLNHEDHLAGRLDSVGREVPGVVLRLIDEAGVDVPDGEPGELLVRSGQILTEYWRDPVATAAVFRDGFYCTGDVAVRDPDGYYRIVGRIKDIVISGGYNVYPIEVENVLADHPAVKEVAVIGVPHPRWGEAVHAVVVLNAGTSCTADDLIGFCRGRIASYKKPQSVAFIEEMPRTTVGKIAKNVLRERCVEDARPVTADS